MLFSASGGISKGAYQGGVDWVISEFLRRQRSESWRVGLDETLRSVERELGASTGASAGNINALFTALGWCASTVDGAVDIPPEQSLFWNAWVNTGIEQLFPQNSGPAQEPALFDRAFFESEHRGSIEAFLKRAEPRSRCNVPVGLTLTKLTPLPTRHFGRTLPVSVQRFATVFNVTTGIAEEPTPIKFVGAGAEVYGSARLGAIARLDVPDRQEPSESTDIPLSTVFEAVLASSSFPVAFAPKRLRYLPAGLAGDSTGDQREHYFLDGGVFDNNPIGLAVGMYELRKSKTAYHAVDVAYSSPMNVRPAEDAQVRPEPTTATGLDATVELALNAFGSAREYEQQAFVRDVRRLQELKSQLKTGSYGQKGVDALREVTVYPWLRPSSRSGAIFGATMYSFGGFLGRLLREYDFYRGIYDGLHFTARHFVCREQNEDDTVYLQRNLDEEAAPCTKSAHIKLVEHDLFEIGPVGVAVTNWMLDSEYGRVPTGPATASSPARDDEHRLVVLRSLHAQMSTWSKTNEDECKTAGDVYAKQLCAGGLRRALDALGKDKSVMRSVSVLRERCVLALNATPKDRASQERVSSTCSVDRSFAQLIADPLGYIYHLSTRVARRLQDVEEEVDNQENSPGRPGWTKPAVAVHGSYEQTYGQGFEINPFAGPAWEPGHRTASLFGKIVPNYFEWTPHRLGTLGWRPLTYHRGRFSVSSSVDLRFSKPEKPRTAGFGAALGFRTRRWWLSSMDFGGLVFWGRTVLRSQDQAATEFAAKISARTLWERVQVSVTYGSRGAQRDRRMISVGLSDLNGWAYWLARTVKPRSTGVSPPSP